jgi:DNA polymerase-3 subunit beta
MKFIVSSQVLLKQLQSIGGVLNSSNTLPILDNFLFEIQDQKLTISCSDLESTMTSTISIDAKSEGSIAIPAKMLLDILKTFPRSLSAICEFFDIPSELYRLKRFLEEETNTNFSL